VVAVTALALTVKVMNDSTLTAEGPVASATLSVIGKSTYVPLTGHTDQSFTVEERFTDINQYERYVGLKVNNMAVKIDSKSMTTVDFGMVGKDMDLAGTTAYFTNPTAQSNTGVVTGVTGQVMLDGALIAYASGIDFTIERATENAEVVGGGGAIANIFTGKIKASGSLSLYFVDGVVRDLAKTEGEVSLVVALTEGTLGTSNALTFAFPRIKFNPIQRADAEQGIMQTADWTALENSVTTAGWPATTVMIQDTSLV
jgi:hypothetical protein